MLILSFRLFLTLLLITAPLGSVFAQQTQRDFAPLEKAALDELRDTNTPGADWRGDTMQKITPFLWYDDKAEEAANFYVSIFKNSKVLKVLRYGDAGPGPKGSVMTVEFELEGQKFVGLNGGPHFKFTEAISFVVNCTTQEEVEYFWGKLSEGGAESQCGWLKDKYGLSWQVVPTVLIELLQDKDAEKSQRVMKAMLQMKKIDIATLKQAYEGE
jgi:predicted 3-demethylubiquinone-9 3-methyltransferase (glyoxalase superfamily)